MKREHLYLLACPECKGEIELVEAREEMEGSVRTGTLECIRCNERYSIIRHIPRFVPLENYASGFGFEWIKHARTQYDSYCGAPVSETRFFEETKWPRDMGGQLLLEVGSGSGRFTEH